jgi:hypothetical protein
MGVLVGAIAAIATAVPSSAQPVAIPNTDDPDVFINSPARVRGCQGCDLRNADLSGKNRRNAQLRQADLSGADLTEADFMGAYFTCANLSGADLRGANLQYANLVDANLSGADLRGADLSKTDLSGAVLDSSTLYDEDTNLDGAKLWDAATLYSGYEMLETIPRITIEAQRVRCDNR